MHVAGETAMTPWRLAVDSVLLVLLLASTWILVAFTLTGTSVAVASAGRTVFTVGGLALLSALVARGRASAGGAALPRMRRGTTVILAITGVSAYTIFSTAAIHFAGAAVPALIMVGTPLTVMVIEAVLNRRSPGVWFLGVALLAVAGAALYVVQKPPGQQGESLGLGIAAGVAGMLSMAWYGVHFSRANAGYSGPMAPRILPIFGLGCLPLLAWAGADLLGGGTVTPGALLSLVILGVVVYVPAYLLQHRILVAAGATYSALLGLAVPPVVGVAAALAGLGPWPSPGQWAATALTLAAVVLVVLRTSRRAREA
ncbi:DMT family transporter [Arthrobacter sp.]|uniref:DMT family transporter n=1 Tax=Arthrobacter sp. TaxID=1667 RepID=UPI0025888E5F|nr:DMT family transporter [Arthrobacter sp.]